MRQYLREVRAEKYREVLSSDIAPSISMLVPAFNEESSVKESVMALLTLAYPQLEIVVVDDGSTDQTLSILMETFQRQPIQPVYDRRITTKPILGHLPFPTVPEPDRGSKGPGRQGRLIEHRPQRGQQRLACPLDADTILDPDGGASPPGPPVHPIRLRGGGRRHHPGGQRLHRLEGPAGVRAWPAPRPGRHPGRGVSPCLPIRAPWMEQVGRQSAHLRRLRPVPPREPSRDPRIRQVGW